MPRVVPSERLSVGRMPVRLCVIGDSPEVRHCAVALVQQGHQVYWLASRDALRTLLNGASPLPVATDILPATCQFVVPVQTYHYEGIRLLCVNQELWQSSDLHTRLFTCLCLLQRALPCVVFHAWGPLPIAYLTVYTARFLAVPAMLSYNSQLVSAKPEQPFLWDWVARQVTAAVVPSPTEQERLLTLGSLTSTQVHVIDPTQPHLGQTLTALYARLSGAATP
jgi:Glycosyltransferase Family 4